MISLNGWNLHHQNGTTTLSKDNWKILFTNSNDCSIDFNSKYIKDKLNLEEAVKFIEEIKLGIMVYNNDYTPILYRKIKTETIEYIDLNNSLDFEEALECHESLLVVV